MFIYLFGVLLLGAVIFIHELGHFLFAKLFGVRVEAFSLGFGKAIVKKRIGDTEYMISIIPLGGYVKMLGEISGDEGENLKPEDIPFSFSHKKWWQKATIAFAGPAFNLISAFFMFMAVSFFNYSSPAAVVEFLAPDGAAKEAGISEGDKILEINGKKVSVWDDVSPSLTPLRGDRCDEVEIKIEKVFSGKIQTVVLRPKVGIVVNPFNEEEKRCEIGISRVPRDASIAKLNDFDKLQNGDKALSIDGQPIHRFYELAEKIKRPFSKMVVLRDKKTVNLEFSEEDFAQMPKLIHGGTIISKVEEGSYASAIGIKTGDVILSINNLEISIPYQFYQKISELKEGDEASIALMRDGKPLTVDFKVSFEEKEDKLTGMTNKKVKWGANFSFDYNVPEIYAKRADPVAFTFRFSYQSTRDTLLNTLKGFWYLLSGKLSAKNLGGPIAIFDISKRAAEAGLQHFLYIMAAISINLALINLFPIPILDGGYIVFYALEGIAKREIPKAVKEKLLMFGFILLLLLSVFAISNDLLRYLF